MYLPYDFLFQKTKFKPLKKIFYRKKIEQNCNYVAKNKKKVFLLHKKSNYDNMKTK